MDMKHMEHIPLTDRLPCECFPGTNSWPHRVEPSQARDLVLTLRMWDTSCE